MSNRVEAVKDAGAPLASIVIPTHNRAASVAHVLEVLARQTADMSRIEVESWSATVRRTRRWRCCAVATGVYGSGSSIRSRAASPSLAIEVRPRQRVESSCYRRDVAPAPGLRRVEPAACRSSAAPASASAAWRRATCRSEPAGLVALAGVAVRQAVRRDDPRRARRRRAHPLQRQLLHPNEDISRRRRLRRAREVLRRQRPRSEAARGSRALGVQSRGDRASLRVSQLQVVARCRLSRRAVGAGEILKMSKAFMLGHVVHEYRERHPLLSKVAGLLLGRPRLFSLGLKSDPGRCNRGGLAAPAQARAPRLRWHLRPRALAGRL